MPRHSAFICLARITALGVFALAAAGCEQHAPPPASRGADSATTAPALSEKELAAIREYQKPAGPPNAATPPAAQAPVAQRPARGDAARAQSASELTFVAPEGWLPRPPRNPTRKAQYALPRAEGDADDGELVLYYFGPGQGGGVEENVARWRAQLTGADGQPLPTDSGSRASFEANGLTVTTFEVQGRYAPGAMGPAMPAPAPRDGYAMIAAVVEGPQGPWFFKATAPKATIEKHRAGIRALLESVRVQGPQ